MWERAGRAEKKRGQNFVDEQKRLDGTGQNASTYFIHGHPSLATRFIAGLSLPTVDSFARFFWAFPSGRRAIIAGTANRWIPEEKRLQQHQGPLPPETAGSSSSSSSSTARERWPRWAGKDGRLLVQMSKEGEQQQEEEEEIENTRRKP